MTYLEYIATCCQMVLAGADAGESSLLNMEQTAEALVPSVFREVALANAANPDRQSLLRRTHTITLAVGIGTLPDAVLTQCLHLGMVEDPDDPAVGKNMSFVPQYFDFVEAKAYEPRLGYWTVKGDDQLHYIRPSDTVPTKTGNVSLTIASIPAVPALATDQLVVEPEILADLQIALAKALRMKL